MVLIHFDFKINKSLTDIRRQASGVRRLKWGVAPNPSYFFVLIQKSNQKKSRLQIILGLLFFGLPTQYNSRAADAAHSNSIAYIKPP
jgi:hypothetical protein